MSLIDSFSALGQQLQQALLKIYQPQVGGQTSLIFVPGGVPVSTSGGLIEPGPSGQLMVNPAQLTSWLESVADAPIQIDIPNGALLGTTVTLTTMSEISREIAQFAVPYADPGTPGGERVAQEISSAAALAGPGVLPLSTVPPDWALPDSTAWNTFDSQQSTETTTQAPAGGTAPGAPVPAPRIWQLRELPAPAAAPLITQSQVQGTFQAKVMTPAASLAASTAVLRAEPQYLVTARAFASATLVSQAAATSSEQTTSVTMSVDHTVAVVDRSPWWQGELIADPGWYVPDIQRGWYVGEPAEPVNEPYALPVAIILARNLSISGTWSSADAGSLVDSGVVFGPFGLGAAQVTTTSQLTTISVPGISLIAMFCAALPVLPPNDPPAAATPTPPATNSD